MYPGHQALHSDEIRTVSAFRLMINSIIDDIKNNDDLINILKRKINLYYLPSDSIFARKLLFKLSSDSNIVKECRYLSGIKRKWNSSQSSHFYFYYKKNNKPSETEMEFWDSQYIRLSLLFNIQQSDKVDYIIDPEENYGRAFPPWEIMTGIKQKELGGNPHELVHILLFKYSDVPFFHEPLAFIYGTDLGDRDAAEKRFLKYCNILRPDKYISAAELIHFPQIIGLDEAKWASAFCFVYSLNKKFGIVKLLRLMEANTWDGTIENFKTSFNKIYGIPLQAFETEVRSVISKN